MGELIAGTRGSALALRQTQLVCDALRREHPGLAIRVESITTTGDARADVPLAQLGRGIFVSEIETALRDGRIDFAVHSAKDMPSTLADDLVIAAFLPREDARDAVVSRHGTLRDLPRGARVGTSSPRRACLLRALRPDLEPVDVRGNVDTRLRKLHAGEYDALILAAAGLIRLGRDVEITEWLDVDDMIPSVGQGALAVETRARDTENVALLRGLDHRATRVAVTSERAFLAELGAGCRAAVGAHAVVRRAALRLNGFIGAANGAHVRGERAGRSDAHDAEQVGRSLARELLASGGAAFLAHPDSALAGRRVVITRAESQSEELVALLRANGAEPVICPTIEVGPSTERATLDSAMRAAATATAAQWIVFTSANAVRAVADRLETLRLRLPNAVRIAAIGDATGGVAASRFGRVDFVPTRATAEALAAELPIRVGDTVLVPHGNLARDALIDGLRGRGAHVRGLVAYRTLPGRGVRELENQLRAGNVDAIVFTSPSTLRFSGTALEAIVAAAERAPAVVCIGPTTAAAAREAGLSWAVEARAQTTGGIVESLELALSAERQAHARAG